MTTYGADLYGASTSYYGDPAALNYAAYPVAQSNFPNTAEIKWQMPLGDWTRLRLVRSSKGPSIDEQDGAVLFDVATGPLADNPEASFTYWADTDVPGDRWYAYTLWVYGTASAGSDDFSDGFGDGFGDFDANNDDWVFAGIDDCVVPNDHGNVTRMQNLIPSVFTNHLGWAGEGQADTDTDLSRFLSIFGFQADVVRSSYESLLHIHNPELLPAQCLPLLCSEFGVPYEPQLGFTRTRVLLRNAMRIHKTKGTRIGVEDFATSLTGWACDVTQGKNMLLDYNDSSAEEGVGNWYGRNNATIARVTGTTVAPYTGDQLSTGCFQLTSTAIGVMEARCGDRMSSSPLSSGIPVSGGSTYTLSAYLRSSPATVTAQAIALAYFDVDGKYLNQYGSAGGNMPDDAWTRQTLTSVAPVGSYWAVPIWTAYASAIGQHQFSDSWQLEAGDTATKFQEARQLQLRLGADRVNEVSNPSFETGTLSWSTAAYVDGQDNFVANPATSLDQFFGDTPPNINTGAYSGQVVTPGIATNEGVSTAVVNLLPNQDYLVSAWVKAVSGAPAQLAVFDYTNDGVVGKSLTAAVNTGWTRLHVKITTGAVPTTIILAVTTDDTTTAASTFRVDGVMVERGIALRDFFDASTTGAHGSDYYWDTDAGNSKSYFYRNFVQKTLRLSELLPDYLWPGMTFNLVFDENDADTGSYSFGGYGDGPYD